MPLGRAHLLHVVALVPLALSACGRTDPDIVPPVADAAADTTFDTSVAPPMVDAVALDTLDTLDAREADAADVLDAPPLLDAATGVVTLAAPKHPRALSPGFWTYDVVYVSGDVGWAYVATGSGWSFPGHGNWGAAIATGTFFGGTDGIQWASNIHPGQISFEAPSKPSGWWDIEDPSPETPTHYGAIMAMTFDTHFWVDQIGTGDSVVTDALTAGARVAPALADHGACDACPPLQIGHLVAIGYLRFFADSRGVYHLGSLDDSGAPATLLAAFDEPAPDTRVGNDIASDGTTLFYSDVGLHRQQILAIPILGGTPRVVVDHLDATPGLRARPRLVVEGDDLYYSDGSNRVMVVPKVGGTPRVIAVESAPVVDLVFSKGHLYWIREGALRRWDP